MFHKVARHVYGPCELSSVSEEYGLASLPNTFHIPFEMSQGPILHFSISIQLQKLCLKAVTSLGSALMRSDELLWEKKVWEFHSETGSTGIQMTAFLL